MTTRRRREATETSTEPDWRRTWRFSPRTVYGDLPPGPWDEEHDKIQWIDKATNMDCLMVRNHFGTWCGYVGVPRTSGLHGIPYESVNVDIHGGLTFSERCAPGEPIDGICHIAWEGREEEPWWFGFDCGHAWDIQPGLMDLRHYTGRIEPVYRDEEWVTSEVQSLARQLVGL